MHESSAHPSAFPLWTLLRYRFLALKNTLHGVRRESRLKVAVVGSAGIIFWVGLFWAFMDFIKFIVEHTGSFSQPLVHYGLSLLFLVLIVMLIFSNALISFSNLFKSGETGYLYSMPVKRESIFLYKLLESLVYSSWAVFALGIPLLVAVGIQTHAEWPYYPLALLMMIPFAVLPAGLGALFGLLLTAYVPRYKGKILVLAAVPAVGVLIYVFISLYSLRHAVGHKSLDVMLQSGLNALNFTRNYMLPNYWMSEGLLRVAEGRPDGFKLCGIFFAAVSSSAIFAVTAGWFLAGSIYPGAFSRAHGMGGGGRRAPRRWLETLAAPFARRNRPAAALIVKDLKTFFRDPAQWAQVLIFFGILVVYNTNIQGIATPLDQPLYKNLTSFLNLGAASMTLATICSRFVFPLISLEGQRFWILGLAPIARREIMWSKFYFAFGGTALLSVPLSALSNWSQHSSKLVFGVQVWTSLMVAFGLSGLTVGMGALFPNFKERNPSKIVSGFGGTLTLILAIGLVSASVGGGGLLFHRFMVLPQIDTSYLKPASDAVWALPFVAFVTVLNLAAALVPMRAGVRALERVEF